MSGKEAIRKFKVLPPELRDQQHHLGRGVERVADTGERDVKRSDKVIMPLPVTMKKVSKAETLR